MTTVKRLTSDFEIKSSFSVMKQLRPHLKEELYLHTIHELQQKQNYQLIAVFDHQRIKALAGYRLAQNLAWGTHMYVDDLITDEQDRKQGYAQLLFDWLENEARKNQCQQLHLDSGVQRHDAHRFYLKNKMDISSHHFQKSYE